MKAKLSKIVVEKEEYLYALNEAYFTDPQRSTFTLKIYLSGYKQTPLVIEFLTLIHYYGGQPLKSGILLPNTLSQTTEVVNLNEPKYIKKLILQGRINGWNGNNTVPKQDGFIYLQQLGYEVDSIKYYNQFKSENTPLLC